MDHAKAAVQMTTHDRFATPWPRGSPVNTADQHASVTSPVVCRTDAREVTMAQGL